MEEKETPMELYRKEIEAILDPDFYRDLKEEIMSYLSPEKLYLMDYVDEFGNVYPYWDPYTKREMLFKDKGLAYAYDEYYHSLDFEEDEDGEVYDPQAREEAGWKSEGVDNPLDYADAHRSDQHRAPDLRKQMGEYGLLYLPFNETEADTLHENAGYYGWLVAMEIKQREAEKEARKHEKELAYKKVVRKYDERKKQLEEKTPIKPIKPIKPKKKTPPPPSPRRTRSSKKK